MLCMDEKDEEKTESKTLSS